MIKKVKGGYVIVHCHGSNAGRRIDATKHPVSLEKANSIHRAIESRRHSRGR